MEFSDWDLDVYSDDGTLTDKHAFKQLHTLFQQSCGIMGRVGSPGKHLRGWVEEAGFTNITHTRYQIAVWRLAEGEASGMLNQTISFTSLPN